jgi:hypothetical protein
MFTISYRPVAIRQPQPKRAPYFFPALLRTVQPDGGDPARTVNIIGSRHTSASSAIETAARYLSRRHLVANAAWSDAADYIIEGAGPAPSITSS